MVKAQGHAIQKHVCVGLSVFRRNAILTFAAGFFPASRPSGRRRWPPVFPCAELLAVSQSWRGSWTHGAPEGAVFFCSFSAARRIDEQLLYGGLSAAVQHERESRYKRDGYDVTPNGDTKLINSAAFDSYRFSIIGLSSLLLLLRPPKERPLYFTAVIYYLLFRQHRWKISDGISTKLGM